MLSKGSVLGTTPSDPLLKGPSRRGLTAHSGQRRARVLTERMLPGGRASAQTAPGRGETGSTLGLGRDGALGPSLRSRPPARAHSITSNSRDLV